MPLAIIRLVRYLKKNPTDIVYVCGVRASLWIRFLRVFFRSTKLVHGIRWNPESNSKLDLFFRLVERTTWKMVDAWITNSKIAKNTLVSRCGIPAEKIFVIYNGLDNLPLDAPLIEDRPLEVLTVANLSPRKGHIEYLAAIRTVVDKLPNVRFVFVGRDDMNQQVQQAICDAGLTDNVICSGFQADVNQWLKRARVFVLPSLCGEGCPTSILEAMSFAIPCIAFAIDGIPELITDGENGALLQPADYLGMAAKIVSILENDSIAAELGRHARENVELNFKLENTSTHHASLFNQMLAN